MKVLNRIAGGILGLSLASCLGHAQILWKGTTGDFFNANNWEGGVVPGVADIAEIDNGGTATIGATAGTFSLAGIRLGTTAGSSNSGHIIMNGGTLNLSANAGDPKAVIGDSATLSTFIMNGGKIFFDGPDAFPGSSSEDGVNGLDWEVGEHGLGRFEMHGGEFYASDDLKIAENAAGTGYGIIDGTARYSTGSGISVGGGAGVLEELVVAGNALLEAGNSLGAGNPQGMSDEGYLTMSTSGSNSKLTIKDNGVLNIRRLTSRAGTSVIDVMGHGQFHIFDVLHGKGFINSTTPPDRPEETGPNSTYSSEAPSDATLILRDDAVMTVNSTQGLGISAPRDAGNAGGTARMIMRDRASFRVEQDLKIGTGAAASSIGTFELAGGNVKAVVGGNLLLAYDVNTLAATPGQGTLSVVLSGSTQSPVEVTGTAYLANGTLKISTTNSFSPALDSTFRILTAGTIDGTFKAVDLGDAKLASGLTFSVIYNPDSVDIKVVAGAGRPQDNGVVAKTDTIYVNTPGLLNNGNTESLGVGIASNGNILVAWEDDSESGQPATEDTEAEWALYDPNGVLLNQAADLVANSPDNPGETINTPWRSYFRADGTPIPNYTAWGPKIKANLFGAGIGMGATAYSLGLEVPEMLPVNVTADGADAGNFPAVQLLTDTGAPVKIVAWSDADTEPDGDVRIGDWDYLANGNILLVGHDRQDEKERLSAPANRQPVFKIVTAGNVEVKGLTLASSTTDTVDNDMWHGSAVVSNGFAIRAQRSLRFFDNSGTPLGPDTDVGALTGDAVFNPVDRGENEGFHGNGKDTYVLAAPGADANGVKGIFVTTFNADGTLKWKTNAMAGFTMNAPGRTDAAIDAQGRVFVVFQEASPVLNGRTTVQGRFLDNTGKPMGAPFLISDTETGGVGPRASWRGDTVAVTWQSQNAYANSPDPVTNPDVVALRLFTLAAGSDIVASVSASGGNITITWTGGTGPFTVQKKTTLTDATWTDVQTTSARTITLPASGNTGFFRVKGQ